MATVVAIINADDHNAERSVLLIQPCGGREQRSDYAGHQPIGAGYGLLHQHRW